MKQRISVLCAVRDDTLLKLLMQGGESMARCTFAVAESGGNALRQCEKSPPDILIADAMLPGLDGPALVDQLHERMGSAAPHIIGGAMMPFARDLFARRGVKWIVSVPWVGEEVCAALREAMHEMDACIDWAVAQEGRARAEAMLGGLGMNRGLHGCRYLSWAAALTALDESRLFAIGERIYAPIAKKEGTRPANVERLMRHAVESTMDMIGAEELYACFGNTIDPMRGKPTNAQMIGMLAQRLRVEKW